MKSFEFSTAQRIIFGYGSLEKLTKILPDFGSRPLLIVGYEGWQDSGILSLFDHVPYVVEIHDEPTIGLIRELFNQVHSYQPDVLVGFGGGSALDITKAIAALLTNPGDVTDYLEVIGKGMIIQNIPLPVVAIPTTAGTGSEVTSNSVLGSPENKVKVSLRSRLMLPAVALVDPQLHLSLPPIVTASTGMDALTQVLEPFISGFATPITDIYCKEGMRLIKTGLLRAFQDGDDSEARQDMALASMFGGIALANAKLGAVHGIAGPFGGMFKAPHGAVCGKLLPGVIKANLRAIQTRQPQNPALDRYRIAAVILTGNSNASPEDGLEVIQAIAAELKLPGLSSYGLSPADYPQLIEASRNSSSMRGNPISLTEEELEAILSDSLD